MQTQRGAKRIRAARPRRWVAAVLAIVAGAASHGAAADGPSTAKRVLCTTFPIYQIARNVAQGREALTLQRMLPSGLGCPHDYVLTPQDLRQIEAADVLVINGLGLESFLGPALSATNRALVVVDTSNGVPELMPMEEAEHPPAGLGHRSAGVNPHLFASPRMAAKLALNVAGGFSRVDPDGARLYAANAAAYAQRMTALADAFADAVKALKNRKIVTEHAVFDYLARDCGLQIVAVIQGEAGQDPSAAEMLDLVKRIKATGAGAVFTEPQYSGKVAQTIAREAGVPAAMLDPVATGPDTAPLDYYETVMRANIRCIRQTLGGL